MRTPMLLLVPVLGCSIAPEGGTGGEAGGASATGEASTGASDDADTGHATTTDSGSSTVSADGGSEGGVKYDIAAADVAATCPGRCQPSLVDAPGPWLLHVGAGALHRVDVATGVGTQLCELTGSATTFLSLTFNSENRLFGSTGRLLYEIDPCTCETTQIGEFPFEPTFPDTGDGAQIYGITPDEGTGLFGISAREDVLVRIDVADAQTTTVGSLGVAFEMHGATFSPQDDLVHVIRGIQSELYTVDPADGSAALVAPVGPVVFGTVGIEIHPDDGNIYACTDDGLLYRVDAVTGMTTAVGADPIVAGEACTNLGAPWSSGPEVCLPEG